MSALHPLAPLHAVAQWVIVQLVPLPDGRTNKVPLSPATALPANAHDPANWLTHTAALALAATWGPAFTTGFVLTAADPFWCLDIDGCAVPGGWSPLALELIAALPRCAVEVSQSGRGLHIWGQGPVPSHASKNTALHIELYSELRFIAAGYPGHPVTGDMTQPCAAIADVVARYFPPVAATSGVALPDTGPRADWRGPTDDAELLRRALRSQSAGSVFGGKASFAQLWNADADALARAFPGSSEGTAYDASSADAALAQHLAFWTGCDGARMKELMLQSYLAREKWEARADYLDRTIATACKQQVGVLEDKEGPVLGFEDALKVLQSLKPAEVLDQWLALALPLSHAEADALVTWVSHYAVAGRQVLKSDLKAARRQASAKASNEATRVRLGPRRAIEIRPDDCTAQAAEVEALIVAAAEPGTFVNYGGALSEVTHRVLPYTQRIDSPDEAPPTVPVIEPLDDVAILARVERVAAFFTVTARGSHKLAAVPDALTRVLLRQRDHQAPTVNGLICHPVVLSDGSILGTPGLHEETGLFLTNHSIADLRPYSKGESAAALRRLRLDVLDGFEFPTEADADFAIAALLTGVQRRLLDQAPGVAVLASTQSSGKKTLVRRIHLILTGRDMPVTSFPYGNEPEMSKQLLAMLQRGPALVCFDNVPDGHTFQSATLASAMTSLAFESRVLGVTRMASAPTNTLFTLTGNNVGLGADEVGRWLTVRLAPKTSRPEERRFLHPDVVGHAVAIRARVLRDAIGLIAGYLNSGVRLDPGSRFHDWDRMVRQPLVWAGGHDPAGVFRANVAISEPLRTFESLVISMKDAFNESWFSARDLSTACMAQPGLRDALEAVGAEPTKSRSIAPKLREFENRIVEFEGAQLRLQSQGTRTRALEYRVATTG